MGAECSGSKKSILEKMLTAKDVDRAPALWRAAGAMNFPDFWQASSTHREPNHPISVEVFVALCFEETACSNTSQGGKPIALGPGQLQVSEDEKVYFFAGANITDPSRKAENFLGGCWDTSLTTWAVRSNLTVFKRTEAMFPSLPQMTMDRILGDNDFAIRMHWRYFDWLRNGNGRAQKPIATAGGLLDAQTGGNKKANNAFLAGGSAIAQAMANGADWNAIRKMTDAERKAYIIRRRAEMAAAIQVGAVNFRGRDAATGVKFFPKFWEFFLPDEYFTDPWFGY